MNFMNVDYSTKIPNNVNLSEERQVLKALEGWHPGYIDWWNDMGPDGFQQSLVYLRTAYSVDPRGWAKFDYVKMPEYRWGIFLADPEPDRRIGFGDLLGEPVGDLPPRLGRSRDAEPDAGIEARERVLAHRRHQWKQGNALQRRYAQGFHLAGLDEDHPAGLLARPSNSGRSSRDAFAAVPECAVTLGYRVTRWLRATVGYSFLYWSDVARPGDQIDRGLDRRQIPTSLITGPVSGPGPVTGRWTHVKNPRAARCSSHSRRAVLWAG